MNKLTTEQLLFAHRIGATHFYSGSNSFFRKSGEEWMQHFNGWLQSDFSNDHTAKIAQSIDFTPLYDWIDHDGGECPVRDDDEVVVEFNDGEVMFNSAKLIGWGFVKSFKLDDSEQAEEQHWPEQRSDAIGQNGNGGEHYEEKPETTHSTAHHKRPDGTDLIDEWWERYTPEVARILMWEQVKKYQNRLGKKDAIHIEVSKMKDYLARWDKKERELAGVDDKPNTIV